MKRDSHDVPIGHIVTRRETFYVLGGIAVGSLIGLAVFIFGG